MAKNNGHWYTDKNGNHYFVEDGQSPKEGWEASKRRKMISGGKYMTSEDGNDYSEVDRDKYEAYEADEADFDENVDDDFGFDEEDDYNDDDFEWSEAEERQIDRYAEHYGVNADVIKNQIIKFYNENLNDRNMSEEEAFEGAMEDVLDMVANGEFVSKKDNSAFAGDPTGKMDRNEYIEYLENEKGWDHEDAVKHADMFYDKAMQGAQEQNAAMSEGQDDDFNRGQTVDAPEKGEGWKKTKMASGTLYEGPNGERYMDDGSAPEKVKIGAKEMTKDEWKDWYHKLDDNNREMGKEFLLNHASEFDMSERDMERFLDGGSQGKYKYGKDSQNRFYVDDETGYRQYFTRENEARDYADRMNAAQGSSQNYNYEDEGHYYKDGRWKPGNHKTNQWAPEYYRVGQKRLPNEPGQYEKDYTGNFPSLEKAQEFASKYEGKDKNASDYKEFSSDEEAKKYFDEHANELPNGSALYGNKIYLGEDNRRHNPTPNQKKAAMADRIKANQIENIKENLGYGGLSFPDESIYDRLSDEQRDELEGLASELIESRNLFGKTKRFEDAERYGNAMDRIFEFYKKLGK